jgi:hypothetical protein
MQYHRSSNKAGLALAIKAIVLPESSLLAGGTLGCD